MTVKNDIYLMLLVGQMAYDNITTSTIQFFKKVYPTLSTQPYMNASEMAELANMSPEAALLHVRNLIRLGYIKRRHFRAWYLVEAPLKKPELINLMRFANAPGIN